MPESRQPLPAPSAPPARRLPAVSMPAYRFVPGLQPHPHKGEGGHRHSPALDPEALWLHGLDLFDHRYYWECHEVLEGRWKALPRGAPERERLQGLIQLAAACLQAHMGHDRGARRLLSRGARRLASSGVALGDDAPGDVHLPTLVGSVRVFLDGGPWPVAGPLSPRSPASSR